MKLILENWRKYVTENQEVGSFGEYQVLQSSKSSPLGGDVMIYSVMDPEGKTIATLQVVPHEDGVRVKFAKKESDAGFYMTDFYKWLWNFIAKFCKSASTTCKSDKSNAIFLWPWF